MNIDQDGSHNKAASATAHAAHAVSASYRGRPLLKTFFFFFLPGGGGGGVFVEICYLIVP